MTQRTVLISGASIAGPALAFWLHRAGFRTVIVERAPELRLGGQNVDIRGAGREVTRRMGIEDEIRAATTGEVGMRFVDDHDHTKAEFPAGTSDSAGPTAEIEILRGDLARLLVNRTSDNTEYVYGNFITGLRETADRVVVSFERGEDRTVDLVVAADGIRSRTRSILFGDEPKVRELGLYMAYLTIPRASTDSAWARWYSAPGSRTILLRPDAVGTTRAALSFLSGPRGYERMDAVAQKIVLRHVFADAGWEAGRVLKALDNSTDMYFESVGQVLAPRWSRGRVALVGDAAYCASPISGMGTSLALVGAYVLAGELARRSDHRAAFASYERIMRPYVTQAQKLLPGTPRLALPKSRVGVALFNTAMKVVASRLVGRLGNKLFTPPADKIDLPDYGELRA